MMARGLAAEWYPTDSLYLHRDREGGMYRISTPRRLAQVVGEVITRGQRPVEVKDAGPVEDLEVAGLLEGLPPNLWSSGPYDMGQTVHTVVTPLKPGVAPVNLPQYRVRPEARAGIDATIKGLKEAGVLIPSTSAWNTPILPVKKPDGTWRMAHDLREVNLRTHGPPEKVPNPQAALLLVTPDHKWFTTIDLANAFYCMNLAPVSRNIFAFTWGGEKLMYTRMPQGYRSTPTIFNDFVRQDLHGLLLPDTRVLVQYVDDLLIASQTREECLAATVAVLGRLVEKGYKCKRAKLHVAQAKVRFLGRDIGADERAMTEETKASILNHPKPGTVQEMMSFLGLCNFSRQYVPDFTEGTAQLRDLITTQGAKNLKAPLIWTLGAEEAFVGLKRSLHEAAALAAPDYELPFHLDVSDKGDGVQAVLYQKHQGDRKNVAVSQLSI